MILKSLVILACLFLSSCMTSEKLHLRTQGQLTEFLKDKIGQLSSAVRVNDALFTIVHLKQQHYSELYTNKIEEQLRAAPDAAGILKIKEQYFSQIVQIDKIQKEIYDFLLASTSSKDFLYVEGRSYPNHYRDAFLSKYIPETKSAANKVLNIKGSFGKFLPEPPFFLGASFLIHKERKMKVLGVENLALLNLTLSLYKSKKLSPADMLQFLKECHEAREDQMIKNMSVEFDDMNYRMSSLRFLICGSKHDLVNNVEKWNKENPHKKANLLEFTPSELR